MNILMLLSQHALTGAEVYAATVSDELILRGHRVWIISDTLTVTTSAPFAAAPLRRKNFFSRIRQVYQVVRFVKQHRIQIIHSHSRASAWVGQMAAKLAGIPHVVTIHGRQHLHISRYIYPALGDRTIAVCEELRHQLESDLHLKPGRIELIRNPVHATSTSFPQASGSSRIALIGRLDGPKGDIAFQLLERLTADHSIKSEIVHIGGANLPVRFQQFTTRVQFAGQVPDISPWVSKSSAVVGAGRVAVEAILLGRPVVAIGESCSVGLISRDNLPKALATNFGDVSERREFDWDRIIADVKAALRQTAVDEVVGRLVREEYDRDRIVSRIETLYQHVFVHKHRYEIPILCYHRVIADTDGQRGHGIWVTASQFEEHLRYFKRKGMQPITFAQLGSLNRLDQTQKYIIITFDDGYADNYEIAFPLLRKYGFTVVIFPVVGLRENTWDTDRDPGQPRLALMTENQIREMSDCGVEFGSHSMTHRSLKDLPEPEIAGELADSKAKLERILGKSIDVVAYPYGDYSDTVKRVAGDMGFKYGVTTDRGPVALQDDCFAIRRIIVFPGTTTHRLARKVRGDYGFRQLRRQ